MIPDLLMIVESAPKFTPGTVNDCSTWGSWGNSDHPGLSAVDSHRQLHAGSTFATKPFPLWFPVARLTVGPSHTFGSWIRILCYLAEPGG